jgi:hypothetical protein
VRNCPDMKRAAKPLQSYKRNQKNLKKHTRSKMTPTDHFSNRNQAKDKKHSRSKKYDAYIADEDSTSNISSECNDDSDNDTDTLVEVCHLSRESIKKAIPSEWLGDTGALSHMSNQPLLFRNFKRIKKRIIKVGGGVMYCNRKGTVDVICKDGSRMTLINVLYIPGLGVNCDNPYVTYIILIT